MGFYSASINSMFSSDDAGNMELEVSYKDSDGKDIGAYAAHDNLGDLLDDIVDQLEESIAEFEKEPELTPEEEINNLLAQIEKLTARNQELETKLDSYQKENVKKDINNFENNYNYSKLLEKLNNFDEDYSALFRKVIA